MNRPVLVGTRGSALALKQAEEVVEGLKRVHPDRHFEVKSISSLGDRDKKSPIARFGSKGVFVAELERQLEQGAIDIAVHSLKDMPSEDPPGFLVGAVPPRLDPRDVLISNSDVAFADLPSGARLGTGSPRRAAQLKAARPDIEVLGIRGNIDTRMRKLRQGQYDGVALAAAGLLRMGWQDRITEYLPCRICLPAVGQGALAVEVRAGDQQILDLISAINDPTSRQAVDAERSALNHLGGGCLAPITAFARYRDGSLSLRGMVADPTSYQVIRAEVQAKGESPEELGAVLAEKLNALGAATLIGAMRE